VLLATQQLIGLASATVFYLVGRRAFRPLVALAGALVFALHPATLFYEISVLTETLFTCSLAVALWALARMIDAPSSRRGVVAGLACGAAVLVRPVAQWFVAVPLALVWMLRVPTGTRLATGAGLLLAYLAAVVPMMAINQREFGFWGVSLGPGMGLYIRVFEIDRLMPPPSTEGNEVRDLWAHATSARWNANRVRDELNYVRGHSSAVAERMMLEFGLDTVMAHPWLATPPPPGAGVPGRWVAAYLAGTPVPMGAVALLVAIGVAALAAAGLRTNPVGALLVATAAYYTLIPALSQWPQDRYRLPVDAILFMLAAHGARWLGRVVTRWAG
jgi:4-amino-4-deoxy-L-arabinose transferase-like glycosyltransferase